MLRSALSRRRSEPGSVLRFGLSSTGFELEGTVHRVLDLAVERGAPLLELGGKAPLIVEDLLEDDVRKREVRVEGRQLALHGLVEGRELGLVDELVLHFGPGFLKIVRSWTSTTGLSRPRASRSRSSGSSMRRWMDS